VRSLVWILLGYMAQIKICSPGISVQISCWTSKATYDSFTSRVLSACNLIRMQLASNTVPANDINSAVLAVFCCDPITYRALSTPPFISVLFLLLHSLTFSMYRVRCVDASWENSWQLKHPLPVGTWERMTSQIFFYTYCFAGFFSILFGRFSDSPAALAHYF